ncbi:hypothetical protein [Azospirillum tabaci]|uniref:hypothetical protein n=1 Tax=Azospirillum tabaci TaxID=2752310 RepID=UPI001660F37B|nr:hypothetical protein [Azospirillum tabaci]
MTSLNLSHRSILAGASAVALAAPGSADAVDPFGAAIASLEGRALAAVPDPVLSLCAHWREVDAKCEGANKRVDAHWDELEQAGLTHDEIQRDPIQRVMWDETYHWSAEVDAAESVICSTPAATPAGILAKLEVWKQTSEALVGDCQLVVSAIEDLRRLVHGDAGP